MAKIAPPVSIKRPLKLLFVTLIFGIVFDLGYLPNIASAQWATNGNDIYNTNSGNIGIGTTGPTRNVTISRSNSNAFLSFNDGLSERWVTGYDFGVGGGYLIFGGNGSSQGYRFYINQAGKVGIGTTAPQQLLSVNGSVNIDQANGNIGTVDSGLTFGNTSGEGIGSNRNSGHPNVNGLDFYTSYLNRISITNTGSVGIGTTNP
jgi:hypothetical protein